MNTKTLLSVGGIVVLGMLSVYMLVTGKVDFETLLAAFKSDDGIYTVCQKYVDEHKVIVIPGAETPIPPSSDAPAATEVPAQ